MLPPFSYFELVPVVIQTFIVLQCQHKAHGPCCTLSQERVFWSILPWIDANP